MNAHFFTQLSEFVMKITRRSARICSTNKDVTNCMINTLPTLQNHHAYIDSLPLELQFSILSYLDVETLGVLTITCKRMRNLVECYTQAVFAQRYLMPKPITHKAVPIESHQYYFQLFEKLGVFLKRSTCLYSTADRLRLFLQFLQRYLCNSHKGCEDPKQCIALTCYGKLLHSAIAGWEDKECTKVFNIININTLMLIHLRSIVDSNTDQSGGLQLHVRLFYRRVFVDQKHTPKERAFWLTLILSEFPIVHRAHIMFLLFGPQYDTEGVGAISWSRMTDDIPETKKEAKNWFGELAMALTTLYCHNNSWTENDTISIIEELFNLPDEWLVINMMHVLYLCGEEIMLKVLQSKAINGRVAELANIIVSLCQVLNCHGVPMTFAVKVTTHLCSTLESKKLISGFLDRIITEFRDSALELTDTDSVLELDQLLTSQALFNRELIHMSFRPFLQK